MATHHGKEGVLTIGGTTLGNATGFTIDTTHDVVEDTALGNSMKSFLVGRGSFTFSIHTFSFFRSCPKELCSEGSPERVF